MCAAASPFFAVDLEFIKCRGLHYCRSIALVPFHATGKPPCGGNGSKSSAVPAASEPPPQEEARTMRTSFNATPTVISLDPDVVMQTADLLPCGHVLQPLLSERLVRGPPLAELKDAFLADAERELSSYQAVCRLARGHRGAAGTGTNDALREQRRRPSEPEESLERRKGSNESDTVSSSGARPLLDLNAAAAVGGGHSFPPPRQRNAPTPPERHLQKELHIRLAVAESFELLDPFGIPNVRKLQDLALLQKLYDCDVGSTDFSSAVQYLQPLRAYGRGKGGRRALSFLLRYHPAFTQEVLRRSFSDGRDFARFLEHCAAVTDTALREAQQVHRSGEHILLLTEDGVREPSLSPALHYMECDSLESFSMEVNKVWSRFLHKHHARKFFAYGNADARVLHTTLELGCRQVMRSAHCLSRHAEVAGGGLGDDKLPRGDGPVPPPYAPMRPLVDAVPSDLLLSPYQARVLDVTSHPLFIASGFVPQAKRVSPLGVALRLAAGKDSTAARLDEIQRPHDPLWDAQALACVCVGSGIVR